MLIETICGRLEDLQLHSGIEIDYLDVEWYETTQKIFHTSTRSGRPFIGRFLNDRHRLGENDVLYAGEDMVLLVAVKPCEAIVIPLDDLTTTAAICYEIGNKHLPLFLEEQELLVPFDGPAFAQLNLAGFNVSRAVRKLLNPLKTSVAPHGNGQQIPVAATFTYYNPEP